MLFHGATANLNTSSRIDSIDSASNSNFRYSDSVYPEHQFPLQHKLRIRCRRRIPVALRVLHDCFSILFVNEIGNICHLPFEKNALVLDSRSAFPVLLHGIVLFRNQEVFFMHFEVMDNSELLQKCKIVITVCFPLAVKGLAIASNLLVSQFWWLIGFALFHSFFPIFGLVRGLY